MYQYHLALFDWHCRTFFPFHRHLSENELRYLKCCFALGTTPYERPASGYAHFSYYTFSHRIDGDRVNSSRMAYGSLRSPEAALAAARPVLDERGVAIESLLPAGLAFKLYGLGWDFVDRHFKLYLLIEDLAALREMYPDLFGPHADQARPEGLLSFTFVDAQIHERKIYFYPRESPVAQAAGVVSQAFMSTSRRGAVEQLDVRDGVSWRGRLGPVGRRIFDAYQAVDLRLDTIAYEDPDHCTLYFP